MSQHPSLRSKTKDAIQRSVLKRYERLKEMSLKENWSEEESVYGLPKLKVVKYKMKKEKADDAAEGAEGTEATADATQAKDAAKKESPKADAKKK